MAANTNPVFPLTAHITTVKISTANTTTASVAVGSLTGGVQIFVAGTNGSRLDAIQCKAEVTTAAGMIRIWQSDGTTAWLFDEYPTGAVTPSGTVQTAQVGQIYDPSFGRPQIVLQSGHSFYATTNNAEAWDVTAIGGDY